MGGLAEGPLFRLGVGRSGWVVVHTASVRQTTRKTVADGVDRTSFTPVKYVMHGTTASTI